MPTSLYAPNLVALVFLITFPLMRLSLPSYFLCFFCFVFVGSPFSISLIGIISTSNWRIQTLMHSILCFICAYPNKFKYKFQLNSWSFIFCVMLIVAIFKTIACCAKEIHGEELCATFVHYGTSMHYCSWIFYETWCFMELQCFCKELWSGILCFGSIMKMVDLINGGATLLGTWTLIWNIVSSRLWSSCRKGGQGNLFMKEGCLFVLFVPMRSTKLGCFKSDSWSLWKALEEEGRISLVSWRLDL